jgi:allantoicase
MSKKIIFTNGLIDLAQPRLGSKVIFKTDDFLANGWMDGSREEKERLDMII